jgi:hypothetical protein
MSVHWIRERDDLLRQVAMEEGKAKTTGKEMIDQIK